MFEVSKTRLTLAMLARGWGNGDLMAAAGICKAVIQRLTTKGGRAANSTFFKIAKALNVEPTMLIKLPDDVEKHRRRGRSLKLFSRRITLKQAGVVNLSEKLYKLSQPKLMRAAMLAGLNPMSLTSKAKVEFKDAAFWLSKGGTADAVTVERLAAALGVKPQDILVFDENFQRRD